MASSVAVEKTDVSLTLAFACDTLALSVSFIISDVCKVLCDIYVIYIYTVVRCLFSLSGTQLFWSSVLHVCIIPGNLCPLFLQIFPPATFMCLSRIALIRMLVPLLSPILLGFLLHFFSLSSLTIFLVWSYN